MCVLSLLVYAVITYPCGSNNNKNNGATMERVQYVSICQQLSVETKTLPGL